MQYVMSQATFFEHSGLFQTRIYLNESLIFTAHSDNYEQSRLNAVKLAMLLAIQESEKMMR